MGVQVLSAAGRWIMRERLVTLYECEICGHTSTDRATIVRCEAQGVPDPDVVGKTGFLRLIETERFMGDETRHEWLVQVRITGVAIQKHDAVVTVDVVPWASADEDLFHRSTLSVTGEDRVAAMLDEVEFDLVKAEESLLT